MRRYKSLIYILCLCSSLIFLNFQCNDCEDELHDRYHFEVVPSSSQISYKIGDTIQLNLRFEAQMKLEFSKEIHDNANELVYYWMDVFRGSSDGEVYPAREDFEFVELAGQLVLDNVRRDSEWYIEVKDSCSNEFCDLTFAMVPKKKGYYGLNLKLGRFALNDHCKYFNMWPVGFDNNGNNNFEIFKEIQMTDFTLNKSYYYNPASTARMMFFKVE